MSQKQKEELLTIVGSSIGTNGYIRLVGNDNNSYRIAIQDLISIIADNSEITDLIEENSWTVTDPNSDGNLVFTKGGS